MTVGCSVHRGLACLVLVLTTCSNAEPTPGGAGPAGPAPGQAPGGAPPAPGAPPSQPPAPPAPPLPPPPAAIQLTALGANGTVGLDWTRDSSARSYRIYWSNTPGVTPATGQRLESNEPALVHRGLTNGTKYYYLVAVVSGEGGEGKLSNEVEATPGGEWALEHLGAGDFDDVVTGARVARLPIGKRLHILLFPEGYLAGRDARVPRPRCPQPHPAEQRRRPLGQGGARPRALLEIPGSLRGLVPAARLRRAHRRRHDRLRRRQHRRGRPDVGRPRRRRRGRLPLPAGRRLTQLRRRVPAVRSRRAGGPGSADTPAPARTRPTAP